MRERAIPEAGISEVIDNYHTRRPAQPRDAASPADIPIGDYDGRDLKIYVEVETNPMMVKTAVWNG